ncbi:glycogen/starch/alpha-glucan phosphorylase [Haploplasma axanthum]|uniref:Alpha-1,4 glucan phosphorylase n=1 Tax=Haploplasma axanthum TaxID=29552 RepID=A0A449BFB0_HAPAX|nr:glycogen/starch/alpha-glucan phosphorylase [Haploplasma axanthum]VEU81126.1 Maltodextrin phosphorylase [Haploplasma axanthum]
MKKIFENKETFKKAYTEALKKQFNVSVENASITEKYTILAKLTNENLEKSYNETSEYVRENNLKKAIYFSMEFLMGRLVTNNLHNSGVYHIVREAFTDLNIDINEIEERESDAGLGNGGLGRLAACFLDSGASLGLPLYGNSIRYKKGFFVQEIVNNRQVEHQDPWLDEPFVWETKKENESLDIEFFGEFKNGKLVDSITVKAVPYDVKVVGDQNGVVTDLRLWSTEPSEKVKNQNKDYLEMVEKISESLYPDDSTDDGKLLRLEQQYLFSAAGIRNAIREHKSLGRDIKELDKYYVFQINDTHPTLIIPELIRILMDEEGFTYDEAFILTSKTAAFTNHTILAEALEKWNVNLFKKLLPRIYEIIVLMNEKFRELIVDDGRFTNNQINEMLLINDDMVKMANICIYGSFSVNGVAALHTDILKNIVMKDFNKLYPTKFNNKTNGITHRRWLMHINKELVNLLDRKIGTDWHKDLSLIKEFEKYVNDIKTQEEVFEVKKIKKQQLADRIKKLENIDLDVNSIFDIQVKRLHEYKRQLMNIMHIIYVYLRLKKDSKFKKDYYPHSFIFGAKSAPSYYMAKRIIELINATAKIINNDEDTNKLLKVVFVENYNVTYAEYIMTAADLSEQISTASKEASGTGNMKFMLNGALTIGTMDGANVEIAELAGIENEFIFGLSSKEVNEIYDTKSYKPLETYNSDLRLQEVFNFIETIDKDKDHFKDIKDNLLYNDYFLVMKDFDAYVKAHERANEEYKNQERWRKKAIINIANAGFFTSDRTINEYNRDIWKLKRITFGK